MILEVKDLNVIFNRGKKNELHALKDINFSLEKNKTLGIVGESGSGKSTLARCITALLPEASGKIIYKDKNILKLKKDELKDYRRDVQMIFQDPYSSLNPRKKAFDIVAAGLKNLEGLKDESELRQKVEETFEVCGLSKEHLYRYPHEFSGGQRQRIAIARALAPNPKILIADEPTSALDVSIQAQIINLLFDLKESRDLSIIFISHDLSVVRHISDDVIVMQNAKIVERGSCEEIFLHPKEDYTLNLIAAIPCATPFYRENK